MFWKARCEREESTINGSSGAGVWCSGHHRAQKVMAHLVLRANSGVTQVKSGVYPMSCTHASKLFLNGKRKPSPSPERQAQCDPTVREWQVLLNRRIWGMKTGTYRKNAKAQSNWKEVWFKISWFCCFKYFYIVMQNKLWRNFQKL